MVYMALIITALLGLIGLVAKTKKDEKPELINKLTPFGVVVLSLLIISFVVSVFSSLAEWASPNPQF